MAGREKKTEIRFKGFTDEWEQCKLGKIAEFNPKTELPEIFEYVDLESVVGTEMIAHREEIRGTAPSRAQRLARQGDLFYQTVRPYQKNNYLFEMPYNNYVFSTGYAQMRPYGDGYFLLSLVQKNEFVKSVLKKCTGTSYPAINSNDLSDMEVFIPVGDTIGNNEQVQIGSFFKNVDNLIALHQRKYDKLVIVKKSLLEKMFPKDGANVPEIRFAGFTDAWEQCKVGEVTMELKQYTTLKSGYSLLTSSRTGLMFQNEFRDSLSTNNENTLFSIVPYGKCTYRHMSDDDIFHFNINHIVENGLVSREYPVFDASSNNCLLFIVEYLNSSSRFTAFCKEQKKGGTRTRLYYNSLCEFTLFMPCYEEQLKIATCFSELDNLLNLHQRELEKLKNIKNALLEKMFV